MALDVGDVRIGIALSDPLGIIAQPHSVLTRTNDEKDLTALAQFVKDQGVVRAVVGLPLNQNGERGPQALKVEAFVELLRPALGIDIALQDERFTTAIAERSLIASNMRRKDRKGVVDKVAAQQILQTYLDRAARQRTQ